MVDDQVILLLSVALMRLGLKFWFFFWYPHFEQAFKVAEQADYTNLGL